MGEDAAAPIPYPSSIFIREKAIVCNLETIRLIIARDEVSTSLQYDSLIAELNNSWLNAGALTIRVSECVSS